jgi:hypothetical protein
MKTSTGNKLLRRGFWILLGLGILLALGSILWVKLLPGYVASRIRTKTGFAVQVAEFSVNPFTGTATIKGLVLINPEGWGGENFVELREFRAKSSVFSFFSNRYVADEVVVDVAQVNLVRNKQGVLNALAFKDGLTGKASDPGGKPAAAKGFLIKKLVMKFDILTYNDHTDLLPGTRKYNLKVDCELHDVDTVAKLVSPFSGSALGLITNTIGNLFTGSTDLLKGTAGLIEDAGKKTGKTLKGLLDSLDKKKP